MRTFYFGTMLGLAQVSNGEWIQVYAQNKPSGNFHKCGLNSCNMKMDSNNFINFDQVKGLSSYRMKFEWDGSRTLEWTQPYNPLSVTDKNMNVCANKGCKLSGGANNVQFVGLSKSSVQSKVLLDGVFGSQWWYPIGYKYTHNGGIPSYKWATSGSNPGYISKTVKLFVWKEITTTTTTTTTKPTTKSTTAASKPTGDWVKVYAQNKPSGNFHKCGVGKCKMVIDSNNFIDFDQVKGLSSYRMKFVWDGGRTLEWTQPYNPLSVSDKNMNVCSNKGCKLSGGVNNVGFVGLSLASNQGRALLDGTVGGSWWYPVGYKVTHNNGIPAYMTSSAGTGFISKSVQLFVWKGAPPTTTAKPTTAATTTAATTKAPTGKWIEIYSQSKPHANFQKCGLGSCNVKIDSTNFINFDQVKSLKEYRMKFDWGSGRTLEWTQSSNPLTVKDKNLNVCANKGCKISGGASNAYFHGLSMSNKKGHILLDGVSGSATWYSVGYRTAVRGGNFGYPNYYPTRTRLFVYVEEEEESPVINPWASSTCEPTGRVYCRNGRQIFLKVVQMTSLEMCRNKCAETKGCAEFIILDNKSKCYLFKSGCQKAGAKDRNHYQLDKCSFEKKTRMNMKVGVNAAYTPELENKSSAAFNTLAKKVTTPLNSKFAAKNIPAKSYVSRFKKSSFRGKRDADGDAGGVTADIEIIITGENTGDVQNTVVSTAQEAIDNSPDISGSAEVIDSAADVLRNLNTDFGSLVESSIENKHSALKTDLTKRMKNVTKRILLDSKKFGCPSVPEDSRKRRSSGDSVCDQLTDNVEDVTVWLNENTSDCVNPKMTKKASIHQKRLERLTNLIDAKCEKKIV